MLKYYLANISINSGYLCIPKLRVTSFTFPQIHLLLSILLAMP